MYKVRLFCDVCHTACVEGEDVGSRTATHKVRQLARQAGWDHTQGVGWTCVRCVCRPVALLGGQEATYIGPLTTADGVALKGRTARIISVHETGTVHALFADPAVGQWAQRPHWFFAHEFSTEAPT